MKKENYSFKQACAVVGGQSAMARLLGVSPPSVNQWIKGVRQLPAERCPAIERATRGEVLCEELRPDTGKRISAAAVLPTILSLFIKQKFPCCLCLF